MERPQLHRNVDGMRWGRLAVLMISVAALVAGAPLTASAEYLLGKAKAAGQVGEKRDGYLGLVDQNAPEKVKKMVRDTNERRTARYESVAKKQGSDIESVGKLAGARLIMRAKPGELIETPEGKWTKK